MTAPESMFIDPNHGMRTYDNPGDGEYHPAGNHAWYARVEATIKAATGHEPDWQQIELAVILDRAVRHDEGWRKVTAEAATEDENAPDLLAALARRVNQVRAGQGRPTAPMTDERLPAHERIVTVECEVRVNGELVTPTPVTERRAAQMIQVWNELGEIPKIRSRRVITVTTYGDWTEVDQ